MSAASGRARRALEVGALFAWLGCIGFGGPAAHVGLIRREVVERRAWLGDEEFADLVGASALVPGPTSSELAMHVGKVRAGFVGMVAAGLGFVLPSALMVGVIAWSAAASTVAAFADQVLAGLGPVVLAIVVHAGAGFGRTVLHGRTRPLVAVVAAAGVVAGVHELLLLGGAAGVGIVLARARGRRPGMAALIPIGPVLIAVDSAGARVPLERLAWSFLKIGATVFGSGYVLVSFLERELVHRAGWASTEQVLDAITAGQVTPGPLFTAATHLGYQLAGLPGAVVATGAIFLPSFLLVGLLAPVVARIRRSPTAAAALDHLNAASFGVLAVAVAVLARAAIGDAIGLLIGLVALLLLWRRVAGSGLLVAVGLLLGVLRAAMS